MSKNIFEIKGNVSLVGSKLSGSQDFISKFEPWLKDMKIGFKGNVLKDGSKKVRIDGLINIAGSGYSIEEFSEHFKTFIKELEVGFQGEVQDSSHREWSAGRARIRKERVSIVWSLFVFLLLFVGIAINTKVPIQESPFLRMAALWLVYTAGSLTSKLWKRA